MVASSAGVLVALTLVRATAAPAALSAALGLVVHGPFPVVDAYVLDSPPDEHRASAYSVYGGVTILVMATGSSALGALLEAGVGFPALFRGTAVGLGGVVARLGSLSTADRLP